jgi:hypothetical protein
MLYWAASPVADGALMTGGEQVSDSAALADSAARLPIAAIAATSVFLNMWNP